jgi:hypothetical protein
MEESVNPTKWRILSWNFAVMLAVCHESPCAAQGGRRRSHDGVLRIRDSPSPLARLHRLVFALESSLQAPIALRAFFIAFFSSLC